MDTSAEQTVSEGNETEERELVDEPLTEEPEAAADSSANLLLLAHRYSDAQHGVYVRHLKNALEGEDSDRIRNIALTGGYGSGKSSILEALDGGGLEGKIISRKPWKKERPKSKIISLALSSLGDEPSATADGQPVSKTNRIQKELVKQLLYREEKVPGSRYRRIGSFQWQREIVAALLGSATLVVLGYITRFTDRLVNFAGTVPVGRLGMHLALFVFVAGVFFGVRRVFHNRLWIEKFIAGPATISLSNTAGSYFDEYLDEIVYFFEATDYDVVIFEDIDRFEDPHIFQTLRELNTILNNSKQLGRNIRFVYAIKDSIFEMLGSEGPDSSGGETVQTVDSAKAENERANRTKFFDLVIPVVPFITHRSSRDHLTEMLSRSGFEISRDLINLVARHIADMRLLKNIHNEFAIFREQLLLPKDRLKGLDADSLFAMVVYKNIHLSDFELIKTGVSNLDEVYEVSRLMVDENIARLDDETANIRVKLARQEVAGLLAESLGEELQAYLERVFRHGGVINPKKPTISTPFGNFEMADALTAKFWKPFTDTKEALTISVLDQRNHHFSFTFTFDDIQEGLRQNLAPNQWERHNRERLNDRLNAIERDRNFLVSADLVDLIDHPEFTVNSAEGQKPLGEVCAEVLTSPLAIDLVSAGHIDRNFTLYTSHFQGVHISLQGMNFILHHIQPNTLGIHFQLQRPEDIQAVLSEADSSALQERSMYNIDIVNFLLEQDDPRCDPIIRNLSTLGRDEESFMKAYRASGNHRGELYRKLASFTPGIFQVIYGLDVDSDLKVELFSAALSGARTGLHYDVDGLWEFIEENYESMDVFIGDSGADEPTDAILDILKSLEVSFPTILSLNQTFRTIAVANNLYDVTFTNLTTALSGQKNLSLDAIKDASLNVYGHVLGDEASYLELVAKAPEPSHTVTSPTRFIEVLGDAKDRGFVAMESLIRQADPACFVVNLEDVSSELWAPLARANRFPPTFANVSMYLENAGAVDDALASLLEASGEITEHEDAPQEAKQTLAGLILDAASVLPDPAMRVQLVYDLKLKTWVAIADLKIVGGPFVGLLIRDRIVSDSASSYEPTLNFDWKTRETAIHHSKKFHEFMAKHHIPVGDLGPLMTSDLIPMEVKDAVSRRLPEFGDGATRAALTEVANYARGRSIELDPESFRTLAAGRADPSVVVELLAPALKDLGYMEVAKILQLMREPYPGLTTLGGQEKLPRTQAHLAIAEFIQEFGFATSNNWERTGGRGEFRVFFMKKPPRTA